jgi:ribonuclease T
MSKNNKKISFASRFRGLLPVVVDVETSGINPATDALLEIAAVTLKLDTEELLCLDETYAFAVEPFLGAHMDPKAMEITGIDPHYPLRFAISEKQALHTLFLRINQLVREAGCQRAVLVGHNAWFDLAFVMAAVKRSRLTFNPFHSFTTFDTATLAAVALGETVLVRAARAANIQFDITKAHSAIYDAERTAELFCYIVNHMK